MRFSSFARGIYIAAPYPKRRRNSKARPSKWNGPCLLFLCVAVLRLSVVRCCLDGGDGPVGVAYLEAGEAAHGDVLAELADLLRDELRNAHGLLLDEGLIEQADLFVELAHLAFDDLLDHGRGLAGGGGLRAIDLLLALHVLGGDVLPADVARVGGGDVHRDVLEQLLEVLGAGNEIALAVELDQHADFAP